MPYFEKFFTLKLNVLKNAFGTRTLKPYRTVNTLPKVTINSSFCRKQLAKIYSASYLIKNNHFLLILGPKHDISKRRLKRRILTLFLRFFWLEITSKKFKSNIFQLNSTRAIDLCMNCHILLRKNFGQFLPNRGIFALFET